MPARFTMTEKWRDKWFRHLSLEGKLLFVYLCDNCDIAGFWEKDFELASFETGLPTAKDDEFKELKPEKTIDEIFKEISKAYLSDDKYFWIKNFLYYQGNLPFNPKSPIGLGIEKKLKQHNSLSEQALQYLEGQVIEKGINTTNPN